MRSLFRSGPLLAVGGLLAGVLVLGGCDRDPAASMTAPPSARLVAAPTKTESLGDAWVVRLQPGSRAADVAARTGLSLEAEDAHHRLVRLRGPATVALLAQDPGVMQAEVEQVALFSEPQDMLMGFHEGEWDEGDYPSQGRLACLRLGQAHAFAVGKGVRIAVLDTGADLDHPWLAPALEVASYAGMGDGAEVHDHQDDDEDGLIDEAFGHGTHIAGLIRTVAPAARILPYRVMDAEGRGKLYDIALGLERALDERVDVVNLSFRLPAPSLLLDGILDRLAARGVRVVAAAGNRPGTAVYPASHPGVIAVAAADGEALAEFSASLQVDIAAPGVELVSSYPGGALATGSGTSMATALVSGALALLGPVRPGGPDPCALLRTTALPLAEGPIGLVNPWGVSQGLMPVSDAPEREGGDF